jgi:hypothetical protein
MESDRPAPFGDHLVAVGVFGLASGSNELPHGTLGQSLEEVDSGQSGL